MTVRKRIHVFGIVQGVGFRPFVDRTAHACGIGGSVCNKGPYVEIFAEGEEQRVGQFLDRLRKDAPERSSILKVETQEQEPKGETEFRIITSEKVKGQIFVSPDIATCPKCREELFDPKNRRYLHPFINCTACGPRLTILDSMPYDRVRTSMGEFPMCPECEYEYTHPETRRYHAQPVCCNDCGPELYVPGTDIRGTDALLKTREVIRDGGIAAIKGIGGFHLCCDATNKDACERLRKLKNRPFKPFAVMLKNMDVVRRECEVEDGMDAVLDGPQKPILLLRKKEDGALCDAVAPDNPNVGVMLPYAPVQMLLFDYPDRKPMTDCFVMTSGNPRGAPICRSDEEAVPVLSPMCDIILSNNRKIRLRADDSVMSWYDGKPYMIRRSRGYAPLPFMLSRPYRGQVLGIGGELKNTFCLARDDLFYPSPYIGDLADLRSVEALGQATERMEELLETKPTVVACDLHPRYNSTAFAYETGLPVIEVQHHYAHILTCMAENDHLDPVIGVSFDGTGYGTDHTIWGGEFLLARTDGFERLGSIAPFPQAGGDKSSKEGWRNAVSLLLQSYDDRSEAETTIKDLKLCSDFELSMLEGMIDGNVNCVPSTSVGRLFDAASAVLGFRRVNTCEGEASMVLQFRAERHRGPAEPVVLPPRTEDGLMRFPTEQLLRELAERRLEGEDLDALAAVFHETLAAIVEVGCQRIRRETGLSTVALSGGCMQNLLLVDRCRKRLERQNFHVLLHSMTPPNDGGIGLGQALYAMEQINSLEDL